MKDVFGLPWKYQGLNGKILFEITHKYYNDHGSMCYVIEVRETYGLFTGGLLIQEYSGFYNRQKDKFVLYPRKWVRPSELGYPFRRHEVSPFWVKDLTAKRMVEVNDLNEIFEEFEEKKE